MLLICLRFYQIKTLLKFFILEEQILHIKYYLKTETNNILDTKIASKLARSYSDNHSLKTLIKEFLNIDISKQFQNSDFGGNLPRLNLNIVQMM